MENLLNPDKGMMIWTIVVFALLVFVVGRFGWGPIIAGLKQREDGIRKDLEDTTAARQEAERLRALLQKEHSDNQSQMQELLKQAKSDGQKLREQMLKEAQAEAARLSEQTRKQLEEEKAKLIRELREAVAGLALQVAEKLLRHSVNAKENEALIQNALSDFDRAAKTN